MSVKKTTKKTTKKDVKKEDERELKYFKGISIKAEIIKDFNIFLDALHFLEERMKTYGGESNLPSCLPRVFLRGGEFIINVKSEFIGHFWFVPKDGERTQMSVKSHGNGIEILLRFFLREKNYRFLIRVE